MQPGSHHGRRIFHFGERLGPFGPLDGLVERRTHELGSAAPQGLAQQIFLCGSRDGLRAHIGIDNRGCFIDDEQGTRERLKKCKEPFTRGRSEGPGLRCLRHNVVNFPLHVPSSRGRDAQRAILWAEEPSLAYSVCSLVSDTRRNRAG